MSGGTPQHPRPLRIITKTRLHESWKNSRDSGSKAGAPGTDRISAADFGRNLDRNINQITDSLKQGKLRFSSLKPVFVPKPHSEKPRVICIPTVRDRLVQRVVTKYIYDKKSLPIFNESSFGFLPGRGVEKALDRAVSLRAEYDWVVRTDIQAFFDRIPRIYLKDVVARCLRNSSLVPLLHRAIDCEVVGNRSDASRLAESGIQAGVGIRQGMPLSPVLANFALCRFDRNVGRAGIEMIRYADDILMFFKTEQDATKGFEFVKRELEELSLHVPDIAQSTKSEKVGRGKSFAFLGREIFFSESEGSYGTKVTKGQIKKIDGLMRQKYSLNSCLRTGVNIRDASASISSSVSSYLGIYKGVRNYAHLESELRGIGNSILRSYFEAIFGSDILTDLSDKHALFLGCKTLSITEGSSEVY